MSNVAGSVAKLASSCLYVDKSELLVPKVSVGSSEHISRASLLKLKLSSESEDEPPEAFYCCDGVGGSRGCLVWRSERENMNCPCCQRKMSVKVWLKETTAGQTGAGVELGTRRPKVAKTGFVKKNLTFIVTDDLEVSPASTIKSIHLLNNLKVTNMTELESVEERVGAHEVSSR